MATIYKKHKYYFGNYLQKAQYNFGNSYKKPNIILATFTKKSNIILETFIKSPILFWQLYFGIFYKKQKNPKLLDKQLFYQSPNIIWQKNYIMLEAQYYSLAKTYFDILNSLTHGKHKLLMTLLPIFQNYFSFKIYGNYTYFFHKKP